jgi:hypothetical protein
VFSIPFGCETTNSKSILVVLISRSISLGEKENDSTTGLTFATAIFGLNPIIIKSTTQIDLIFINSPINLSHIISVRIPINMLDI